MKKKETRLYNVLFPIWFLIVFPITWFVILPGNFIIDLLVIVITMKVLKIQDVKYNSKKIIIRTWLIGFASDGIGVLFMIIGAFVDGGEWWYQNITNPISYNPFSTIAGFLWTTSAVAIAGYFIYLLNYKYCFNKSNLDKLQKKKLALSLAIFTAPYLFYYPSQLLYNN